ncbi:MAG: hypothetical protein JF887_04940 [Candidatus Dormibacteraeota bacterium]|uniref:Uncharacterized protein n=1 Tax=Candidatus Amunia macphersoniae TaxID=3127014 RepID=A0A934KPB9_9BACT|nr:hypothetical protein [Candidatus Dormibacteraeota bacterium]
MAQSLAILLITTAGLAACGSSAGTSSPASSGAASTPTNANSSASGASGSATALAQDDCTAAGVSGPVLNSQGGYMTMAVASGWKTADDMGTLNVWKAVKADGSFLEVSDASTANGHDSAAIAATQAHNMSTSVMTCPVAGEKAYLISTKNGAGATIYHMYIQHGGNAPLQVFISPGDQAPAAALVPDVKGMLGSWRWASP